MKQVFRQADFFENGGCIAAGKYTEHRRENIHSHEFFELSYIYDGRGIHINSNGERQYVKENDFIIISPEIDHCMISPPDGRIKVYNLLICAETLSYIAKRLSQTNIGNTELVKFLTHTEPFCFILHDSAGIMQQLLESAVYEYSKNELGSDIILENTAVNLFIMTARIYEKHLKGDEHTTVHSITDIITRYVRANYSSELSLRQLANLVHISPEYLSRLFKKVTGKRLYDFITETRINKACYYLCSTTDTIDSIAMRCGYDSIACFRRAFKSLNNMSASEYRKSKRSYNV